MIKKIYNLIRYHFYTIQAAEFLISSPLFLKSPLSQKLVKRGLRQTKKAPLELMIEPTNLCNLACLMCPHKTMKREKGIMSNKLFQKIIDQAARLRVKNIKLAGMGEPLLDKDIVKKIAYAKKKNLTVKMFTNAMPLNKKISKQLIESGIDEVIVSIDGGSRKTLERIRKGASFSKLQTNLENFNLERQKALKRSKKIPELIINVTHQKGNKQERKLIQKTWGKFTDKIRFFPIHNWGSQEVTPRPSFPCHLLFFQMAICWDGRVTLCCIDYECQYPQGNLNNTSLEKIWQSKKVWEIRQLHLRGKSDTIPPCRSCSMQPNWFFTLQF